MNRWDIINHFIEKNDYKTYLEIGYYKGWSFDNVRCPWKIAVDPNPSKEEWMTKDNWGSFMDVVNGERIQIDKETSDDFFARLSEDTKADIIFIDGLHEASQVEKDIKNSLNHLSPRGTIVLHDCNPPKYEHTTTGIDGCWTGDAYRAWIKFRMQYPEFESYTVNTDWGCGVIHTPPREGTFVDMKSYETFDFIQWQYFDKHRETLLNLVSIEEFIKRTNERTKNTDVPA